MKRSASTRVAGMRRAWTRRTTTNLSPALMPQTNTTPDSTRRVPTLHFSSSRRPSRQPAERQTNPRPFAKPIPEVRLNHGPIGPVRLDEYGTPILDIHIRKVARVNGKLTNTIVKTYPQVSQFWTYDPNKFIEQPVFSRDFPRSQNLE